MNKLTKECLDNWQTIEKEDWYKGIALSTLRSLYTFVKNHEPNTSTNRFMHKKFKPNELVKVERYDKLIEEVSQNVKGKFDKPKMNNFFNKRQRILVPSQLMKKKTERASDSYGRLASRALLMKFLKGQGNITSLNAPKELGAHSLYDDSYQGRASPDRGENVAHYFNMSCAAGSCIPDPMMTSLYSTKFNTMTSSMRKVQDRMAATIQNFMTKGEKQTRRGSQQAIRKNFMISL